MFMKSNLIKYIRNIKSDILDGKYLSNDNIEYIFYEISRCIWDNIDLDNIKTSDFTKLSEVHDFLIEEICKIHEQERDFENEKLFREHLSINPIKEILNDGKRAQNMYFFSNEEFTYYFIGDLHSDTVSLKRILEFCDFFEAIAKGDKIRVVFLGDYVDRGKAHLKTVEMILLLKYFFSNHIYLIRGNHDGGDITNGEINLPVRRDSNRCEDDYFGLYTYNLSKANNTFKMDTVRNYLRFFNSLSNLALFAFSNLTLMVVHGGLPRPNIDSSEFYCHINSISDLTNEKICDKNNMTVLHNMLWSDPCDELDIDRVNSKRFQFNKEHFMEFSQMIGIDKVIRGHEAEPNGFKEYYEGRLITLFSSGKILNNRNENINNETVYRHVSPCIIKKTLEKDVVILDLNKDSY